MVSLYSFNFNRIIIVEKCEKLIARNVWYARQWSANICSMCKMDKPIKIYGYANAQALDEKATKKIKENNKN